MRRTSALRGFLSAAFLAGLCSAVHGQNEPPPDTASTSPGNTKSVDFAPIFSHRVTIPTDVEKRAGEIAWKAVNLLEKDAPRFGHAQPRAGDFALYYVSHATETYGAKRALVSEGDYLMLEIVIPKRGGRIEGGERSWTGDSNFVSVRVYGAAKHRDLFDPKQSSLAFRGLISGASWIEFPIYMPSSFMGSCEEDTISIRDVAYFRNYAVFAAETNEKSGKGRDDELIWTKLEKGKDKDVALGQLWRLEWDYTDMNDPAAGVETVVVSEKVPVRGLVFAKDAWSSSSGVHNHVRTVQLVNYGRLTGEHVKAMQRYEDVLPEELKLWKELKDKLAPKEP